METLCYNKQKKKGSSIAVYIIIGERPGTSVALECLLTNHKSFKVTVSPYCANAYWKSETNFKKLNCATPCDHTASLQLI